MKQFIQTLRYAQKTDWTILGLMFLALLVLLTFSSCSTLNKAIDYADDLSKKLDEYGPTIKDTANKIGNVAGTIQNITTGIAQGYDKISTEVNRVKEQLVAVQTKADLDKNGNISLSELLKYLIGLGGIAGAGTYVVASKNRKATDELWDTVSEIKSKVDFPSKS